MLLIIINSFMLSLSGTELLDKVYLIPFLFFKIHFYIILLYNLGTLLKNQNLSVRFDNVMVTQL